MRQAKRGKQVAIKKHRLRAKATIHHVTTMLATSTNVLFPGHNHLLTTGTDDPSFAGAQAIIKMSGHQHRWLAGVIMTWKQDIFGSG